MTNDEIREIAFASGFKARWSRPGFGPDLHGYVFDFACAVIAAQPAAPDAAKRISDLEIECATLQHGIRLYERKITELEAQLAAPVATGSLIAELREHDDPRLYQEADVLMSRAVDHIATLEQTIKNKDYARQMSLDRIAELEAQLAAPVAAPTDTIAHCLQQIEDYATVWAGQGTPFPKQIAREVNAIRAALAQPAQGERIRPTGRDTLDQMAAVMLLNGTPEQQEQAVRYASGALPAQGDSPWLETYRDLSAQGERQPALGYECKVFGHAVVERCMACSCQALNFA